MSLPVCLMIAGLIGCGQDDADEKSDPDISDTDGDSGAGGDSGDPGEFTDEDRDGFTGDIDCDDNDFEVNPAAPEVCDGIDNNCDGLIDEGFDQDGDGATDANQCPDGQDCDDTDPTVCPTCEEIAYDGIDQDCAGGDLTDADGDGFDAEVVGGQDCDDADAAISPAATDIAKDGIDQDCDGADSLDADGDGYDDVDFGGADCDDTDASISPGAFDFLNDAVDADCDGRDGRALALLDASVTVDGTSGQQEYTGSGVAVCDLDDDGLADLVVSSPLSNGASTYGGVVGIWYGANSAAWTAGMPASSADTVISGDDYGFLGLSVACGDVDGDGYVDLLASTGEYGPTDSSFGIGIWYGQGGALSSALGMSDADAYLAYPLLAPASESSSIFSNSFSVGDLDGDGAAELMMYQAVNVYTDGSLGAGDDTLWIIPGQSWSGEETLSVDTDHVSIGPDADGALSAWSTLPDFDGDGTPDLGLYQGAFIEDESVSTHRQGRASFVSGWPALDAAAADVAYASLNGDTEERAFGWAGADGDFDGDGTVDVVLSAITETADGDDNAGALYVYRDASSLLTTVGVDAISAFDDQVLGARGDGYLGSRLRTVGDINGDGCDDLLVREPGGGTGGVGRMRVLSGALLDGVGLDADDIQLIEMASEDAYASTGLVLESGDIDGDGVTDMVITARTLGLSATGGVATGRVYVYLSTLMGIVP